MLEIHQVSLAPRCWVVMTDDTSSGKRVNDELEAGNPEKCSKHFAIIQVMCNKLMPTVGREERN